jgi:hypothetical protein
MYFVLTIVNRLKNIHKQKYVKHAAKLVFLTSYLLDVCSDTRKYAPEYLHLITNMHCEITSTVDTASVSNTVSWLRLFAKSASCVLGLTFNCTLCINCTYVFRKLPEGWSSVIKMKEQRAIHSGWEYYRLIWGSCGLTWNQLYKPAFENRKNQTKIKIIIIGTCTYRKTYRFWHICSCKKTHARCDLAPTQSVFLKPPVVFLGP